MLKNKLILLFVRLSFPLIGKEHSGFATYFTYSPQQQQQLKDAESDVEFSKETLEKWDQYLEEHFKPGLCEKLLPQMILKVQIFSRSSKASSSELGERF